MKNMCKNLIYSTLICLLLISVLLSNGVHTPAKVNSVSKTASATKVDFPFIILLKLEYVISIIWTANTKNGKIVTNWKLVNMDQKIEITGGTDLISLLAAIGHEALDPDTVCIGY